MKYKIVGTAACLLAISILFGAFGAHGLKSLISNVELENWKTATYYQTIHALALLLLLNLFQNQDKLLKAISRLFLIGILLFSGSLYILACKNLLHLPLLSKYIWFTTPLGGLFFIIGWIRVCIASINKEF